MIIKKNNKVTYIFGKPDSFFSDFKFLGTERVPVWKFKMQDGLVCCDGVKDAILFITSHSFLTKRI